MFLGWFCLEGSCSVMDEPGIASIIWGVQHRVSDLWIVKSGLTVDDAGPLERGRAHSG
jgi:hypothetical protein